MIPDFIKAKDIFREHLFAFFAKAIKAKNPMAVVPSKSIIEGDGATIVRENNETEPFDFHGISSNINYSYKDIPNQTINDIYKQFIRMADDFAEQQFILSVKEIDKAVEKIGNKVSGKLTPQMIFEMTKKRLIPFDENGRMINQMMIVHPDNFPNIEKVFKEIEENPILKKEYDSIMEDKKREWRDRENSRKLVD